MSGVEGGGGKEWARTTERGGALAGGARGLRGTGAGVAYVADGGWRVGGAVGGQDIRGSAVPGPSAVLTARARSGLPVDRFC
ncbi:16S rRNA (cytidine(1402)-2'-O)-methyltransferase, partial [Streptomyces griseus]|nr:16S rRNA (cytidine(1402)-2'-O)-methyltransferase [Streptomyces griseus]